MKAEQKAKWEVYGIALIATFLITFVLLPVNVVNIPGLKPGEISPLDVRSPISVRVLDREATEKRKEEAKKRIYPVFLFLPCDKKEIDVLVEKVKELNQHQKAVLREILSSYCAKGIISRVPEGYARISLVYPDGKRVVKSVDRFLTRSSLNKLLKEDLSHFIEDKELVNRVVKEVVSNIKPNVVYQEEETETLWKEAEEKVRPVYITLHKGEVIVKRGEKVSPQIAKKIEVLREEKRKGKGINKYLAILGTVLLLMYVTVKLYRMVSPSAYSVKNILFSLSVITLDILLIRVFTFFSKLFFETLNIPIDEKVIYVPIFTSTIFASMFITKKIATVHIPAISIIPSLLLSRPEFFFVPVMIGTTFSCFDSRKYRSRETIYKSAFFAGGVIALVQILLLIYYKGFVWSPEFAALPLLSLFGSLVTAIVVNGLSPIMVNLFRFTTDMLYMELINLNHPLLRKLILKAPGTYSHSVMVATLAEAAAEAIGVNALLAKAGGLFHDVGKLKNPQAFIENQVNGINIHDKLSPEKSAALLRSHVEYGEELGKKYGLPEKVIDIIKQHHGTKLMKFFYHKALEMYGKEKVEEKKFRYPGPKPQFKESGIVMLADTVEAAVRSMKNKNFDIDAFIHKLIMQLVEEGQLNQSGLSLKELSLIEKVFKKVLSGVYHNRIEYPDDQDSKESDSRD